MKKRFLMMMTLVPLTIALIGNLNNNINSVVETKATSQELEEVVYDFSTETLGANIATFNFDNEQIEPTFVENAGLTLNPGEYIKYDVKGFITSSAVEINIVANNEVVSPDSAAAIIAIDVFGNVLYGDAAPLRQYGSMYGYALNVDLGPSGLLSYVSSFLVYGYDVNTDDAGSLSTTVLAFQYNYSLDEPIMVPPTSKNNEIYTSFSENSKFLYKGDYTDGKMHISNNIEYNADSQYGDLISSNVIYKEADLASTSFAARDVMTSKLTISTPSTLIDSFTLQASIATRQGKVITSGEIVTITGSHTDSVIEVSASLVDVPYLELAHTLTFIIRVDYTYDASGTDSMIVSNLDLEFLTEGASSPISRKFINSVMFTNEENTCQTRFYEARNLYLALPLREQVALKEQSIYTSGIIYYEASAVVLGMERYLTWATILGEDPYSNTSLLTPTESTFKSDSVFIIVTSTIALIGVASYLIVSKRKKV